MKTQRTRRWIGQVGAGLALALASAAPAQAPKIEALGALKGEGVYEIDWSRTSSMSDPGGGAARAGGVSQHAKIRIKPEDPEAAAQAKRGEPLIFLASVESVRLTVRDGETETTIERPKITLEEPPDTPTAKTLTAIAGALGSAEIRLFVIAGERVARVGGLDAVEEAADANEDFEASGLGLFGFGELGVALTPIFTACGAGAAADLSKGWTTEETTDMGPAGALQVKTAWAPPAPPADGAFKGATTIEIIPVEGADPTAPTAKIETQKGEASLAWDVANDRLASFTDSRSLVSHWSLAGLSLSMTVTSEMSIRRAAE